MGKAIITALVAALSAGCVLLSSAARADLVTHQSASSQVDAGGITQLRQDVATEDGFASSVAIWPPGQPAAQGRTAARSRAAEIAVNAKVFNDSYSSEVFDLTLSQAFYSIQLDASQTVSAVGLDFFLPPSYLELVKNVETPYALEAIFLAELRVCYGTICSISDQRFFVQANASGMFYDLDHSVQASGDPSLDLTPLLNPTVTDSGTGGFARTYLVEFPEFLGHLDLGILPADTPLTVEYVLQARASGRVAFSSAIAAINDPFELDGDPVQQGVPLVLTQTIVPEPATALLVLAGVGWLGFAQRRVHRRALARLSARW
jgi:hypothetical protein